MSAIFSIDSSSDEEIHFFPVTTPKPADSDDDEVIFCGTNIVEKSDNEFRPISSYLKGKDVTIQTVKKKKPPSSSNSEHDDVQFLGYAPKTVDKSCSLTKVRKAPRSRPQSNVNININSEKSTSNLISIDIEDADSNQKKVKLTFLGPSRRQLYNSVSTNNIIASSFNPISTSSPKTLNNNFSNVLKNQKSIAPRSLKIGDTSSRIGQRSNTVLNQQSKSQFNHADNHNFGSLFPAETVIHNFKIPETGEKNVSKSQSQTNARVDSQGRVFNKAVLNESNQGTLNRLKNILNQSVNQFIGQSTMTSKVSNSTVKENKIVSKNKSLNKSTEKLIKNPETFTINTKNLTVENQSKTIKSSKSTSKDEITIPESKSKSSLDDMANIETNKLSPSAIKSKPDKVAKKESAVRIPELSTSGIKFKSSHQSSESENESSTSDTSSDTEQNKHSMNKSDLDKLFNQFLDHCCKNYPKKEVSALTNKLRKLYKKSTKVAENEDFIFTLKEANLKVENKSIRCPLDRMKQVQAQLRKNSPDNIHKIKRLENVLGEINKKIKQLEEAEVTSDEEECNNNYIILERYQMRAVKIYEKICELSSLPADAERATRRNVSFLGSAPSEFSKSKSIQGLVNKVSHALEKYYNKCRKFPDFNDVNILMNKLSVELSIKIKPSTLTQLAKSIFVEFGNMLQRRRLHDDYRICMEYLGSDEEDPYHYDPFLAAKLDENRRNRKKEQHVLDKFCLKQIALKEKEYLDNSDAFSSNSSNESDTDRRRKKSKNRRDKSENEDSDSSGNHNVERNRTCDESSNDSSYDKKKSSKWNRKRTRTSSESDSSSSGTKRNWNKRHKNKKNKLVRNKSQDSSSDNDSEFQKSDKPETYLERFQGSGFSCDEPISENDAPLESESVAEKKGNERVICETKLIENENIEEMGTLETGSVKEMETIEIDSVEEMEKTENEIVKDTEMIGNVKAMGTTETDSATEMETIENECAKDLETIEIDSAEEMETTENEIVEDMEKIVNVKEMGTTGTESVKEMETIENECTKDMETIQNECTKDMKTIENECTKDMETIENVCAKDMETIDIESAEEMESTENEIAKEIESIENVKECAKDMETIENECAKEMETIDIESAKEMESTENEIAKEIESIENVKEVPTSLTSTSSIVPTIENVKEGGTIVNVEEWETIDNVEEGVTIETESVKDYENVKETVSIEDEIVEETESVENDSVQVMEIIEKDSDKEINKTSINVTFIENNEGRKTKNSTNQENNDNNFDGSDANVTHEVTEQAGNNEENETDDQGNLSIQIVNVETCSEQFSESQDEDSCESEPHENKAQSASTEITHTIELSDDDDCIMISEEKTPILTDQEVMEHIQVFLTGRSNSFS